MLKSLRSPSALLGAMTLFLGSALPALAGVVEVPTVSVPEPMTLAAFAAGVGGLYALRKFRR